MGSGPLTKIQKPLDRLDSRILHLSLGSRAFPFPLSVPADTARKTTTYIHQSYMYFQLRRREPRVAPSPAASCRAPHHCFLGEKRAGGSTRVHRICGGNIVIRPTMLLGSPLAYTTYVILLVIIVAAYNNCT